jgi:hypothetical protein
MISSEAIAEDLQQMAAALVAMTINWPEMDEEDTPMAAVRECEAILLDAAVMTQPHPEQTAM